jgi:cytochrome P450
MICSQVSPSELDRKDVSSYLDPSLIISFSYRARQDTVLPLSKPVTGRDGSLISEIHVPKGTNMHIGIRASNINPDLWGEDAQEWKPERWLKPLPKTLTENDAKVPGVYSHLMTFLGGARACIGFKFSQLEMSGCDIFDMF